MRYQDSSTPMSMQTLRRRGESAFFLSQAAQEGGGPALPDAGCLYSARLCDNSQPDLFVCHRGSWNGQWERRPVA
jgi:hypothetical protein